MDKMKNPVEELLYAVLPKRAIVDIMVTAFEGGGTHYWLDIPNEEVERAIGMLSIEANAYEAKEDWGIEKSNGMYTPSEALIFLASKSPVKCVEEGTGMPLPDLYLSSDNIVKALQKMRSDSMDNALSQILGETWDADSVDSFVQYLVLGEIVYG